jgi:hypothetical protein
MHVFNKGKSNATLVMEYKQNLPTYRHDFENYPWITSGSEHYIFHYTSDGAASHDIEQIIKTQESSFQKITEFLGKQNYYFLKPIEYYFYPDSTTKKQLMGDEWFAQAIFNEWRVHVLYTDDIKPIGPHEDTHLLSLPLGLAVGFIQEGLAEYMVGHDWFENNSISTTKEGINKKYISLTPELLLNNEAWLETSSEYARYFYSLAATFVDFLIKSYGKENFFTLYRKLSRENNNEENELAYETIFGIKTGALIENFSII